MLSKKRLKSITGLDGYDLLKFVDISTEAIPNNSDKGAASVVVRILQKLGYPGPYEIKGTNIKCGEDVVYFHHYSYAFGIVFDLLKFTDGNKKQIRYIVKLRDSEIELIEDSYIIVDNDRTIRYQNDRYVPFANEYELISPEKKNLSLLDCDSGKEPVCDPELDFSLEIRPLNHSYSIPRKLDFEAALFNQQDFSPKAIYALLKKYFPEYNFKKNGVEIDYSSPTLRRKITVQGDKCIGLVLKQNGELFEINSEQVVFQNDNTSYICSKTCLNLQTNNRDKHAELHFVEDRIRETKKMMKEMLG